METELLGSIEIDRKPKIIDSKKKHLDRRQFIKYFSVGTAGLILPISIESQASDQENSVFQSLMRMLFLAALLEAKVSKLNISEDFVYSASPTAGSFYLTNDTNKKAEGNLKLSLINEWDYTEFSSTGISYSIPPNTLSKYSFTNGPSAIVTKNTPARLLATTKKNRQASQSFLIRA